MAKIYVCKYCGGKASTSYCVCASCHGKLVLVRKLRRMLAPYRKYVKKV